MFLLGGVAAWAHREGLTLEPWHALRAEAELDEIWPPGGAFHASAMALCVGAGELEPALARDGEAAPSCRFLPGTGLTDDATEACVANLMRLVPEARERLGRGDDRLDAYDADDVVMQAFLVACTIKFPPPLPDHPVEDARSSFMAVVQAQRQPASLEARRATPCDAATTTPPCVSGEPPFVLGPALTRRWQQARCSLDEPAARILHARLIDDRSFGAIGHQLGLREADVRAVFRATIVHLRAYGIPRCGM